jgi:hypothetical protein
LPKRQNSAPWQRQPAEPQRRHRRDVDSGEQDNHVTLQVVPAVPVTIRSTRATPLSGASPISWTSWRLRDAIDTEND